jgi:hypothetical protein
LESDEKKIECLVDQVSNSEETINYLKKSFNEKLLEVEKTKDERDTQWQILTSVMNKLDKELFRRISIEYANQTLREHIECIHQINKLQITEMKQISEISPFNEQVCFKKKEEK